MIAEPYRLTLHKILSSIVCEIWLAPVIPTFLLSKGLFPLVRYPSTFLFLRYPPINSM